MTLIKTTAYDKQPCYLVKEKIAWFERAKSSTDAENILSVYIQTGGEVNEEIWIRDTLEEFSLKYLKP